MAAGTVQAKFTSASPYRTLTFVAPGGIPSQTVATGVYNWTRSGGDHVGAPGGSFSTFCIELTQSIATNNTYTYTVMDLADAPNPGQPLPGSSGMGEDKATKLKKLWAAYRDGIGTNATLAAAFQVAVWEVVYEDSGTYDTAAGQFYISTTGTTANAVRDQANTWLSTLPNLLAHASLAALSSETHQDQLVAVPTPAAASAGCLLLAGTMLCTLKRRRGSL